MFRAYAPFLIHFSREATEILACPPAAAAATAFREIAALGCGFDIAHAPVTIAGVPYAASARVMRSGTIVIELDASPKGLSPRVVTGEAWREATRVRGIAHRRIVR